MVGRFESGELRREALAHETLTARQGLAGKCWCLVGTFILAVGLHSVLGGSSLFGGLPTSLSSTSADASSRGAPAAVLVPAPSPGPGPSPDFSLDDEFDFRDRDRSRHWTGEKWEEPVHLGTDYTLMSIVVAVLFVGVALVRSCIAPAQPAWNQVGGAGYGPWGGASPGLYAPSAAPGTLLGSNYQLANCARDGRYIDVKPGELRGAAGGGMLGSGWMDQWRVAGMAGGMDWGRSPQAGGGWPSISPQGSAAAIGGSWYSPVPSPYSNVGPNGLPGAPGVNGQFPGLGGWNTPNFGQGYGMGGSNLPSEPEVTETYVTFQNDLQQGVPNLMNIIDKQIIEPLIQELDESDKFWSQSLAQAGYKFTVEAPTYPGMGPQMQNDREVSVFTRYLPPQLLQQGGPAGALWDRRQTLEAYLIHPDFLPAQRQFVLGRLREWRDRGLANSIRAEWRCSDQLPTDAHILENLLIKMLNISMEFDKCFRTGSNQPPVGKHLGQSPVAYLRQVTDQTVTPKPPPHYEVWTLTRVWKLRPGGRNLFEALAILIHTLKRHGDPGQRSFQAFPPAIRNAVEPPGIGSTIGNLAGRVFPSFFGGFN